MNLDELKHKAALLPEKPGVYIMRDRDSSVIYVGKAKKLKNRVSQYFVDTASHSLKTKQLVSKIHHFDVIVAASEFEALVLECSLIKRHLPKYNILLKDDKGYPYLRLNTSETYPKITMVSKIADDGAEYFGPYGSRSATKSLMEAIVHLLKLPDCNRTFPKDIGKGRPCLNFHMGQCAGWCQLNNSHEAYQNTIYQARELLLGNYKQVAKQLRTQMMKASDALNFELASVLRDKLNAVETLGRKQLVTASNQIDTDVIGYFATQTKACFTVLHYSNGNLVDKDYEIFSSPDDPQNAVSSLLKQYYLSRGFAPKVVFLPFKIDDSALFSELLSDKYQRKTRFIVPQRGDNVRLINLAHSNAQEELMRITDKEEKLHSALSLLKKMLDLESLKRIEAYDISNISGTDIVASMVVYEDGKPKKGEYKRFKIDDLTDQDDYASMHQVITRRFTHYLNNDEGFSVFPDLILIDGGVEHAQTALDALQRLGIDANVFGMVKDNRHRTRALVTAQGAQINIDSQQSVFSLIGSIQEETHRFAITYHRQIRSKRLRRSALDAISGIGPKRKEDLLKTFGSVKTIGDASVSELERVVPKDVAIAVYQHFHKDRGE